MRLSLGLGLDRMQRHAGALSPEEVLLQDSPLVAVGSWWAGSWANSIGDTAADWDEVALMRDQSGNGNDYSQSEPSSYLLYRAAEGPGGIDCAVTDGVDDYLSRTLTGVGSITGGTILMVMKAEYDPANVSRDGAVFDGFKSNTGLASHLPYQNEQRYCVQMTDVRKQFTTAQLFDQWRIVTIRSKDGQWDFSMDGEVVHSTTSNTFGISSLYTIIGRATAAEIPGFPFWGSFSGLVIYPTYLEDPELALKHAALTAITGISTTL